MPMYKMRPPENFPIFFNNPMLTLLKALNEGDPPKTFTYEMKMELYGTAGKTGKKLAHIEQRRFSAFRYMIKNFSAHPYQKVLENYDMRVNVREYDTGWGLFLTCKYAEDLTEVLQNALMAGNLR